MMSNKDSRISFPAEVVYVDLNAIMITYFPTLCLRTYVRVHKD